MPETSEKTGQKTLAGKAAPETVGFRLSKESGEHLAKYARQAGVSPHALAREFVEQVLCSGGSFAALFALQGEVAAIRAELSELRKDISTSTAVLLVSAGRTTSEAAKAWVEKNLNRE